MKLIEKDIYLRPLKLEDAEGDYPNWFNDKEVCKYNSHGQVFYTKEMAISYIKSIKENPSIVVYAICDKKTHAHIGNISMQDISKNTKSAELAIIIGKTSLYSKGVGFQASSLIIRYGFEVLDLSSIHCGTSVKNIAMQKLAEKLNFVYQYKLQNSFTKDDESIDTLHYKLTRR